MSARFRPALLVVSLALASAALLSAGTARAQAPADNKAAAKEHYTRGTSFYDLGHYDEAIKEFEAAYELKNDPAFLYNLAQSYRMAGKHDQALHFYKTYLRYVPKAANKADIEEKIKIEEQAVAQQGGGITPPPNTGNTGTTGTTPPNIGTTGTPPPNTGMTGTTPPVGSEPAVTVPPTSPPGGALPPGYTPPPGYPPPAAAATDPGRKFRIAGLATGGAGAVMIVVGIVEWRRAVSASNEVQNAATFDPAVQDRGKSAEKLQWVFYGLGLAAVGAGAGLWFYGQHLTAAETTTWRVSLAPAVGPNQGGALLRVAF